MWMTLVVGNASLLFAAWLAERGAAARLGRAGHLATLAAAILPGCALGVAATVSGNATLAVGALLGTAAAAAATFRGTHRAPAPPISSDAFLDRQRAIGMLTNALAVSAVGAFLTERAANDVAAASGAGGGVLGLVVVTASSVAPSAGAHLIRSRAGRAGRHVTGLGA